MTEKLKTEKTSDETLKLLGEKIKSSRITKNKTIPQVAEIVKFSEKIIFAIEEGTIQNLNLNTAYLIAYIRKYLNFLNLSKDIIEQYKEEISKFNVGNNEDLTFYENIKSENKLLNNVNYKIITYLIILGFIAFISYKMFQKNYNNSNISSSALIEKTMIQPELPTTSSTTSTNNKIVAENPVVTPTSPTNNEIKSYPKVSDITISPKSPQAKIVPEINIIELELQFNQDSWVSIQDATGKKTEKLFKKGEQYSLDKIAYPLKLTIGNAKGTKLLINGKSIPLNSKTNVAHLNFNKSP